MSLIIRGQWSLLITFKILLRKKGGLNTYIFTAEFFADFFNFQKDFSWMAITLEDLYNLINFGSLDTIGVIKKWQYLKLETSV